MAEAVAPRRDLNDILGSLTNAPHTVTISRYDRASSNPENRAMGYFDYALTYKAQFKIECKLLALGVELSNILIELQGQDIQVDRIDMDYLSFKASEHTDFKFFNADNQNQTIRVNATMILTTPEQLASREERDAAFIGAMKQHINQGRTVEGEEVKS